MTLYGEFNGGRMFHDNTHGGSGGNVGHVILRTKTLDLGAHQLPGTGNSFEVADFRNLQGVTGRPLSIIVHDAWMVVDYVNTSGPTTITLEMGVNAATTMFVGTHNVDPLGTVGQTFRVLRTNGTINFINGEVGVFGCEPNLTIIRPATGVSFPDTPSKTKDISPGIVAIQYISTVGSAELITGYARGYLRVSMIDLDNGVIL